MARPSVLYLLIALVLSAQFDDAWVIAPVLPGSAVADNDDEYLPSERRQHAERSAHGQNPAAVSLNLRTVDFFSIRRSPAIESELAEAFGRSQLYVFMSLQC